MLKTKREGRLQCKITQVRDDCKPFSTNSLAKPLNGGIRLPQKLFYIWSTDTATENTMKEI